MNKHEFLEQLRKGLKGLPKDDIDERLSFYSEMIDDRVEDGLSEEDAVSETGNAEDIVSQIIADTPLTKIVKERIAPKKKMNALELVFLILGSPIWLSLLLAALAVILALYAVLWSVIAILWAAFASVTVSALAAVAAGVAYAVRGDSLSGFALAGAGIVCAGLSIFMFFGCRAATKGILILTKKIAGWIKNCLIKKEELQ